MGVWRAAVGRLAQGVGTYDRAPMEVRAEIRRNTTLVVAAAAGYALLAVVAGDVTRPLSPGEAAALPFGAPDPVLSLIHI